jgi:hypothetical protein
MSIFENNGVIGIESRGHVQVFLDNDSDATSSQFTIGTNGLGSGLFGVYESGNVGIGTTSPDKALMVSSTDVTPIRAHRQVNSNGNVVSIIHSANDSGGNVTGYASTAGVIENSTDGAESGAFAIHTTAAGASTEKLRVSSAGNVGVGTAAPDAKLHVVGAVKIVDGTQGAGKVLTSDANGVASWQTASASPTIVTRYKTANETLANSAALQDDDDLTFSIGANEVWAIDLLLNFSANSVPDIQVAFNGPAGLDDLDVQWHTNDGMTGSLHAYETSFTYNNGNTDATAIIRGFVKNGATPGTFALRWAQNTSNATAIIMRAGSHLIAHKLN